MSGTGDTGGRGALSDLLLEGRVLREAGVLAPMRPDKALRVARTFLRWGASPATGVATAAIEHPHEIAILDERGSLPWHRLPPRGDRPSARDRDPRRTRLAHLGTAAQALQRARPRLRRDGNRPRRRG